ncbi:UNVERIFIED_ORG: phage baseplate assembly protein W [Kosakonia oryzae]|uniref:Baseplate assembly protein W n=1 Tax=Kosakonia radicincitans TaxID=283686 RepID=A0AAX2EZN6_9ENTR|nr:baseplate assembly protein [Kosakonia radicincitans]MDP9569394.1 phage baseplate assembly protein W [Kosakonia oryzae]SFF41721.1 hypothetical protein SAMN03159468_05147 [Kosakonia radicincitans]SFR26876.1 hypothetical protein SAMN03159514_05097 [Kosakonia radicincitans]SFU18014.1 hypothetical protein SAMN03159428_05110 [Kosakonia radicincitans]SFY35248.1 hypothetical protein SAMN03159436_05155 [Kosakonia radicincitans]
MTVNYTGMSRVNGRSLTDSQHISQSMGDILRTPVGSRVMRREYGSLLSTLSKITTEQSEGRMTVNVTGQLVSTGETLSLTIPVS